MWHHLLVKKFNYFNSLDFLGHERLDLGLLSTIYIFVCVDLYSVQWDKKLNFRFTLRI